MLLCECDDGGNTRRRRSGKEERWVARCNALKKKCVCVCVLLLLVGGKHKGDSSSSLLKPHDALTLPSMAWLLTENGNWTLFPFILLLFLFFALSGGGKRGQLVMPLLDR